MTALAWLMPCALTLGLLGLIAFVWSLLSGQFEDLEGASWRAMEDAEPDSGEQPNNVAAKPGHSSTPRPPAHPS